jgi:monoterpene epsilon-lactone hydrolase
MAFELKARFWFRPPKGSTFRDEVLRVSDHSVPVLWAQGPNESKTGVILYFHGGGYFFGSPGTHSAMLGFIAVNRYGDVFARVSTCTRKRVSGSD